jgi:8-oxo-dGTP pyrophosphatase MutT (NUDIX family)
MVAQFYVDDPSAPAPNRPRRLGVAVALWRGLRDEVLLEYRADADYWAFISGGVRAEESLLRALQREVREETGRELTRAELIAVFSNPTRITAYPDGNVSQIVTAAFSGELEEGPLAVSEESRALEYFPVRKLNELEVAPTHRQFADLIALRGRDVGSAVFVD